LPLLQKRYGVDSVDSGAFDLGHSIERHWLDWKLVLSENVPVESWFRVLNRSSARVYSHPYFLWKPIYWLSFYCCCCCCCCYCRCQTVFVVVVVVVVVADAFRMASKHTAFDSFLVVPSFVTSPPPTANVKVYSQLGPWPTQVSNARSAILTRYVYKSIVA